MQVTILLSWLWSTKKGFRYFLKGFIGEAKKFSAQPISFSHLNSIWSHLGKLMKLISFQHPLIYMKLLNKYCSKWQECLWSTIDNILYTVNNFDHSRMLVTDNICQILKVAVGFSKIFNTYTHWGILSTWELLEIFWALIRSDMKKHQLKILINLCSGLSINQSVYALQRYNFSFLIDFKVTPWLLLSDLSSFLQSVGLWTCYIWSQKSGIIKLLTASMWLSNVMFYLIQVA